MAEKVTVKGGGQIDGAHFENAASEVTLERVANAIEKLEKKLGGKGGGKAEVNGMFSQALAGNAKQLDTATDRSAVFSGMLKETSKETKNFASSLASAASSIIGSGLGIAFGLVAAGTTKLFEAFTESLDSFREVSAVGASFNNDLVLLRKTAAEAAMPLGMFTESIKKNSQLFAQLGGTVTGGAQAFAKMSSQLRTGAFGTQMMGMGMTMGDLNDYMTDYLDIQMRMGRVQGRTEAELLAGTQDYILEMDKLSKATGLSRKQIDEGLKKAMVDGRMQFMASQLRGQALTNFQAGVSLINNKFPEFADTLTDSMSGIVKPGDRFASMMASNVNGFSEFNRSMAKGTLSQDQMIDGYKQQKDSLEAFFKGLGDEESVAAQVARDPELAKMQQYLGKLNEVIGSNTKAAKAEQDVQNKITIAMATFGQKLEEVKSKILLALINSKIFEKVQAGLLNMAEWFNKNVNKIAPFFDDLIKGIDDNLAAGDLSGAISSAFQKIFEALKPVAMGAIRALFESPENTEKRKNLTQQKLGIIQAGSMGDAGLDDPAVKKALADVQQQIDEMDSKSPFGNIKESLKSVIPGFETLEKIVEKVDWAFENWGKVLFGTAGVIVGLTAMGSLIGGAGSGLGGAIGGLAKGIGTGLTSILTGLATGLAAFANPATIGGLAVFSVGVGVVTLAMMGLGKALEYAAPGIEALSPILTKVADVIGTVVVKAFDTLKDIANIFLDGFKAIPDVFERLANIGATNLISTSAGIVAVGAALAVFAAGGALASLVSGTGLINLAEGLKALGQVDGTMLEKLAPPLAALSTPLAVLGGSSVLALIGGNSLSTLANSLKTFEEIDPSKIANVGPALEGLHKALSMFTGGNEGLFSSIGTALGSLVKGDNGLGKLAESFKAFNVVDGANLNNVATGMTSLKTSIGDDLSKQADGVKTFADSIKSLSTNIKDLQTSLEKLNKTPGGPQAATSAAGAASQGRNDGSVTTNASAEKLEKLNTLVTELVSVAKETRDFNKDQVDAIKDRGSAMGRK